MPPPTSTFFTLRVALLAPSTGPPSLPQHLGHPTSRLGRAGRGRVASPQKSKHCCCRHQVGSCPDIEPGLRRPWKMGRGWLEGEVGTAVAGVPRQGGDVGGVVDDQDAPRFSCSPPALWPAPFPLSTVPPPRIGPGSTWRFSFFFLYQNTYHRDSSLPKAGALELIEFYSIIELKYCKRNALL
ncbi:hypothetical protein Taro_050367, partial [Colocasia esculenta]|nr:hypothetical protein [Colocasia esculenta]